MIYFDNSATTELSEGVKKTIIENLAIFGNPSSLHKEGNKAHLLLEEAREKVQNAFGVGATRDGSMLVFTSCGSEADNMALFGTANAKERRKNGTIITTNSEHPAIENTLKVLEKQGYKVLRVPTANGVLDFDFYEKALKERPFLVSLMTVNNETGALYDIEKAFQMAKSMDENIVTHTDCVQGFLKCNKNFSKIHADLISISGHKIHAPKGVGALRISSDAIKRKDVVPFLYGGGQENGLRSGTENLLGILAFAKACEEGKANLSSNLSKLQDLHEYAKEVLTPLDVTIHQPKGTFAPHILNIAVNGYKSETLVHALASKDICVSSGSACSSHDRNLSRSLLAFGLNEDEVDSSLRLSFSSYNTKEEIDLFAKALLVCKQTLIPKK